MYYSAKPGAVRGATMTAELGCAENKACHYSMFVV